MLRISSLALITVLASVALAARHPIILDDVPVTINDDGDEFVGPIRKCPVQTTDQDINDCVVKMLEDLKPRIGKGLPEIGFKGIDPFLLSKFDYQQKFGPVRVDLAIKDIRLEGLSQYKNLKMTFDTKNKNMTFEYEVPEAQLNGFYKAAGTAVLFPITGSGPAFVKLSDIRVSGYMTYAAVTREDGKAVTQIKEAVIEDFTLGGMNVRIRGLFNGNPVMSSMVHYFANSFGSQLFEALLKDDLSTGIADILKQDFINPFLYNLPHLAQYIEN